MTWRILQGDALAVLPTLPAESVQCCVTSPPYWRLRDYGVEGQLGLERTPEEYVAKIVAVFREVRRVLRPDGTLWLNLGDCYATGAGKVGACPGGGAQGERWAAEIGPMTAPNRLPIPGLKPKDLVGIPWRVAFALQADGWFLRQEVVWHKPNPMPESVRDRPTRSHEQVFLLTKSGSTLLWRHRDGRWTRARPAPEYRWKDREDGVEHEADPGDRKRFARINLWEGFDYFYEADAIREPLVYGDRSGDGPVHQPPGGGPAHLGLRRRSGNKARVLGGDAGRPEGSAGAHRGTGVPWEDDGSGRNARSVWTVSTKPYAGAHFAVMPWDLAERCVRAGSGGGDTVLDPFSGAGTTGLAVRRLGRSFVGVELNPSYIALAERRIVDDAPLLNAAGRVA